MSNALLASKTTIVEEQPRIRSVAAIPTAVLAMVGITERGPIGQPNLFTSFEEWRNVHGGFTPESLNTAAAVEGFFEEGGQFLWFVRTVHYTDIDDAATKTSDEAFVEIDTAASAPTAGQVTGANPETFILNDGDTLVVDVDGGGDVTATFNVAAASVTSTNAEPFALSDGDEMSFEVDNGPVQSVTFNTGEFAAIGAATAAEVAAVINAEIVGISAQDVGGNVVIASDTKGTLSDLDNFADVSGTPVATIGFTGLSDTGTGDAADSTAVTVTELKTLIEGDIPGLTVNDVGGFVQIVSNTTGPASSIAVDATSTMDGTIGLDNATHSGTSGAPTPTLRMAGKYDGAYANTMQAVIKDATNGEAASFDMDIVDGGIVIEAFQNLLMDDANDQFVEKIVNADGVGSFVAAATDLDAGLGSALLDRPANGTYNLNTDQVGDNGLAGLADADFIGSSVDNTGIRAFDTNNAVTLLAIPERATAAVANAMLTYCEITRGGRMFAIIDPPEQQSAQEIITYVETTAAILNLSEYGAIYWPRVQIINPNTTVFDEATPVIVPPSGHIAGVVARTDASRPGGVYQQPAGQINGQLRTIIGFEKLPGKSDPESFDEAKRDLVFPKRINPLDQEGGIRNIDGARTLKGNGNFPSVGERRGVIFIEFSIKGALDPFRHFNNTPELQETAERISEAFLLTQMRLGAFRSQNPTEAFFIDFGRGLNPDSVVFAGQLIGRIGLATNKPAEFIILKFSQDTRALEQELSQ